MKEHQYDIVIIGGGPAGSACGIFLKKLNPSLRVCILDKQSFPRKKPCGDGLSPGVADIIKEAGLPNFFQERHPIQTFEFSCGDGVAIKYDLQNLSESNAYGYVFPREPFDDQLMKHAVAAGVDLFQKHEISGIREIDPWCTQLTCQHEANTFQFSAKVVVCADGAYSKMRSYLNIPPNDDQHTGVTLRYYCKIDHLDEMTLRIDILKNLGNSYGWLFPVSETVANVGIGVDKDVYKRDHINLNKELDNYLALLKRDMHVELIPGTRAGYPLPYGSQLPELVHGNKVLIGDAASMINPLTGEGIYYAMYAGKSLAEHIAHCMHADSMLQAALSNFASGFKKQFHQHYQLNLRLKKLLSSPLSGILLHMVAKDKALLNRAMKIVLGNSNSFEVKHLQLKVIKRSTMYVFGQLRSSVKKVFSNERSLLHKA
jgi:geranylgeranyl reductase family protein